jgi:cation transport ATPase
MKNTILGMLLLFVAFSTQAQENQARDGQNESKKSKNAKYTFEVNGNCEQCKKRIEKAAFSVSGVKMASWNIDTHEMMIMINEEKCSLLDVKNAIATIGHDTKDVKAKDEVYDKLHHCCKYERE